MSPGAFPGHLFALALRLRMGLPAPARCTGGRCRCNATKAGTGRTERAEWDIYGNHLSGQCASNDTTMSQGC